MNNITKEFHKRMILPIDVVVYYNEVGQLYLTYMRDTTEEPLRSLRMAISSQIAEEPFQSFRIAISSHLEKEDV